MQPTIFDGSLVLVNQWAYLFQKPRAGEIVVFQNPKDRSQLLCKRITGTQDGGYILRGDNETDSLDSRTLGPIPGHLVLGKIFITER